MRTSIKALHIALIAVYLAAAVGLLSYARDNHKSLEAAAPVEFAKGN